MIPSYIREPNGKIYVNPVKRHVKPFWLTTDPEVTVLEAAGTPGDTVETEIDIDTRGHFEWIYNQNYSLGDYLILIKDVNTGRDLMNRPIHIRTLASLALSGQRPFKLPESYFFNTEEAGRSVKVQMTNLEAFPNQVKFVMHGRRWYHKEAPPEVQYAIQKRFGFRERTYAYWIGPKDPYPTIAALGTATVRFSATDAADSEISKLTLVSTGAFTFRLRERASSKTLMNGTVHSSVGFGTGEFPFIWAETLLLERNYDLDLEMTDISGAPNTIYPTLTARRLQYA